mmetsp:Transcript_24086/g.69438  ORF Transcript_24086/g.69438 Transcript_24086/m.69438 type:complete len:131 (+) Transcript_24086:72-464(+)
MFTHLLTQPLIHPHIQFKHLSVRQTMIPTEKPPHPSIGPSVHPHTGKTAVKAAMQQASDRQTAEERCQADRQTAGRRGGLKSIDRSTSQSSLNTSPRLGQSMNPAGDIHPSCHAHKCRSSLECLSVSATK